MACEYHSPSFHKLRFHREHTDVDLVGRPEDGRKMREFMASLGFDLFRVMHVGSSGAGWFLLKNKRNEKLELCLAHALDEKMLGRSSVTVPLECMVVRSLLHSVIVSQDRAQDAIATLLDHDLASGDADGEQIDLKWTKLVFASNPGRVLNNLGYLETMLGTLPLDGGQRGTVLSRIRRLEQAADETYASTRILWPVLARIYADWGFWPYESPGSCFEDLRIFF